MKSMKKAIVLSCLSTKGGVYKTTTALHIAGYLAKFEKKKVLLIDSDFIQSLSLYFTYVASEKGISSVLENQSFDGAISHLDLYDIDIVYNDDTNQNLESELAAKLDAPFRLNNAIEKIKHLYDYIVIDTNPNTQKMLECVVVASNIIVTPILLETMAARELWRATIPMIESIKSQVSYLINRDFASHVGFYIQIKPNSKSGKAVKKQINEEYNRSGGITLIDQVITNKVAVNEACAAEEFAFDYKSKARSEIENWYKNLVPSILSIGEDI